jgi:hypothetical protein
MKIRIRQLRKIIREAILQEGNIGTKTMNAKSHLDNLDCGTRIRRGDMNGNDITKEIQREFPDVSDMEASKIAADYIEGQY